jgi:hypothetical protein
VTNSLAITRRLSSGTEGRDLDPPPPAVFKSEIFQYLSLVAVLNDKRRAATGHINSRAGSLNLKRFAALS